MRRWNLYADWLRGLRQLGYQIVETVLDAHDFGVSQNRRRLFVICDREKMPNLPIPCRDPKATVRSVLQTQGPDGKAWRFSLLDMPGRAKPTMERARRAIRSLGPNKPFLIVYYGSDAAGGWQKVNRPLRTITTLDRFAFVKPNGIGHVMRMLQPVELAAAMGFPDDYVWPETTRRNRIKLVGNAVSPPVMKAIVQRLIS
jgi:DNA (cytosine-5)-methyltransferase 1